MNKNIKNKSVTRFAIVQAIYCIKSLQLNELEILNFFDGKNREFFSGLDESIEEKKIDKNLFSRIIRIQNDKKEFIEKLIDKNINKNWDIQRLPVILHSILIAAVSEMIVHPKLSLGIIVTEYLKITECFFLDGESAFVNAFIEKAHSILISSQESMNG